MSAFSGDGILLQDTASSRDTGYAVAVQPDDKIVIAGDINTGPGFDMAVARYLPGGALDTTFGGGDGLATFGVGSSDDFARAVAVQPDGSIVVAGYATVGSTNDFAVARLTSSGSLDTSFDGDGRLTTAVGTGNERINSVALQSDGRIVVAGFASNGTNDDFAVARYNANGSLDTGFDLDGIRTEPMGASSDFAWKVLVQPDGAILVGGESYSGSFQDHALLRLTSSGALDTTFSGDGKQVVAVVTGSDGVISLALQGDGRIITGGHGVFTTQDYVVTRFTASGDLDPTFSGDGIASTDFIGTADEPHGVALQADGSIMLGGQTVNGGIEEFSAARFTSTGNLDTSFDTDGRTTTSFGGSSRAWAITMHQGKPLLVGRAFSGRNMDVTAVRYTAGGALDTTFDGDGTLVHNLASGTELVRDTVQQPDGKFVSAGRAFGGLDDEVSLTRINPDGTPDTSFGTNGAVVRDMSGSTDEAVGVHVLADGKLLVGGHLWNGSNYDYFLARFTSAGVLDTTFGTGGKVQAGLMAGNDYAVAMTVQADGKVVLVGYTHNGTNFDAGLMRFNADGTLDTTFDLDGRLNFAWSTSVDFGFSVIQDPDGKLVVGGTSNTGTSRDFAIARLNADGSFDATFDGDGRATTAVTPSTDFAYEVVRQADGRYVLAGEANTASGYDMAAVRYLAGGALDTSFDGDGIVTVAVASGGDGAEVVQLHPTTGAILLVGVAVNASGWQDLAAAQLTSTGALDPSLDGDGRLAVNIAPGHDVAHDALFYDSGNRLLVTGEGMGPTRQPTTQDLMYVAMHMDATPPPAPSTVNDGTGTDIATTPSKTVLSANWSSVVDGESGLDRYEFCMATSVDCSTGVVVDWTSTGTTTSATRTGLALSSSTTYYTCVRTFDIAGNQSSLTRCSNGQRVEFAVTGTSPSSVPQGRQDITVRINGTGFASGDTLTIQGADITVVSRTFVSATAFDVVLRVSSSGTPGARDVTVTKSDGSVATGTGVLTITAPTITVALSTLGYDDAARDTTAPNALGFGLLLPGSTREIGPSGSGQLTAGAAVEAVVTSDTNYVVRLDMPDLTSGTTTIPASRVAWKHFGVTEPWRAMTTAASTIEGPAAPTSPSSATYRYDLRVEVPAAQAPGTYTATATWTVVAAA